MLFRSDWVELINRTDQSLAISGYTLSDDPDFPNRFTFAEGTIIPANGFLVLTAATELPFQLSAEGESLQLFDNSGQRIDHIRFGRQIPDTTLSRFQGSIWQLGHPTPLTQNQSHLIGDPVSVRIEEFLTQPRIDFDPGEFLELQNHSHLPVALSDLHLSDTPEIAPQKEGFPPLSYQIGRAHV